MKLYVRKGKTMVDAARTLTAARRLELVMTVGIVLLALVGLAGVVASAVSPVDLARAVIRQGGYGDGPLVLWQAWTLIGVLAIHLGVWIALLVVARGLFRHIARENPEAAVQSARLVALLLWGMLAWGVVSQMIASVAATWGYPEGERMLSIAFGTPQISVAFAALIASFLAHAFALGAELWQDHREVI
jgi:hypothetical protein